MADLKRVVELVVEDELSAGMAAATASIEKFDAQVRRSAPTAEGLAAKLDHLTRAEANLAAVVDRNAARRRTLDEGLRQNTISVEQHTRSLQTMAAEQAKAEANVIRMRGAAAGAAQGADALASSTQQVNHQMRALTQQMPDVVSGLLTGQQPFMILVQQGGQVVQVMGGVGAALKGVATYLGGPWVLAGVAAAATMGAMVARSAELANQQRQLDVALRAVGASGVTSAAALADYSKQLERAGVAKDAAMSTVQGLARNPSLTQQDIQRAAQLAPDLAAGLGIEVPDAAKRLADALAGGYEGVKKLDDALNVLTVDQRNAVRVMLEHGETGKAADLMFEALSKRLSGLNRDSLTPMGKALRDAGNAWSGFMDQIAKSQLMIDAVVLMGEAVTGISMMVRGDTGRRPAPPAQPGDATADDLAGTVSRRDALLQRYTAAQQGQGPALTRPMLAEMESEIGRLNVRIDDLRAKQTALASAAPASIVSTAARPDVVTDRNEGLQDPGVMRQRAQMKEATEATEAERRQIEVLKSGLPVRDAVRARIEATAEAGRRGLEGAARTLFIETKVQAATLGAADAAGQHLAATQREAVGLLAVAQAADSGRAAMIVARAATEAHEKAATEAGVAESALRDAIVNRAAAQEAEKGADKILDLREQADAIAALIAAEQKSPQDAYWAKVNEKVRLATLSLEAHRDAATDPKIKAALDAEIARIKQLIPQVERLGAAQELVREIATDEKQIALLQKQIELVGKSADERERELAIFRARQTVAEKGGDLANLTAQEKAFIDSKARLADMGSELRKHQNLYDELANSATRAFETVGDAITQAFVQGQGAAVNWGSVTRGVMSAVVQQAIKLAAVNPILNGLFGGERASLWTGLPSLLGGGAAAAGGGGSLLGSLGQLTGLSNLLPSGGLSGITAGLNSYLFGTAPTMAIVDPIGIPSAMAGSPGLFGTAGSMALSDILGPLGIGAGVGGLLASVTGGNSMYGSIGGGLGALAGSLILPGIGTILGSLLGGGLGGMIGPNAPTNGWGFALRANGGNDGWGWGNAINLTDPFYNEQGRPQFEQATASLQAINAYMAQRGLTVYGARAIGGNRFGNGNLGLGEAGSFGEALASLHFGASNNAELNTALASQTFDDPAKLQAFVEGLIAAQDTIKALTAEPVAAFTQQMQAVNDNFEAASAAAQKYGLSETALTAARARAIAKLEEQRTETLRQTTTSLNVRYLRATGAAAEADLAAQAEAATQELRSFGDQLDALAVTAAERADFIARLQITQLAERNQIQQQQYDSLVQPLLQAGGNIRLYLDNLASGTNAGASPTDRLASAQSAFQRDLTLASGGDRDALGRITQQADAYLSAGRDVNASGPGYQAILQQVTSGLGGLPAVQTYDAQMAATLDAIHQLFENGTAGTLTAISASGNIVQLAGGASVQGVVDALGVTNTWLAAANDNIIATTGQVVTGYMATANALAVIQSGIVAGFGALGTAAGVIATVVATGAGSTFDGLVAIATNVATGSAATAAAATATATNVANGAAATVSALGYVLTAQAVTHSGIVAGFGALGSIAADSAAASVAGSGAIAQVAADGFGAMAAGHVALATIAADASAAAVAGTGALATILVDGLGAVTSAQAITAQIIHDRQGEVVDAIHGVRDSVNVAARYAAAVAWNTKLQAGEPGILISPEPGAASGGTTGRGPAPTIYAFAQGGVPDLVNRPTLAPMALFGEAGPEAVVPLTRMGDGALGVAVHGLPAAGSAEHTRLLQAILDALARLEDATRQIAEAGRAAERDGIDAVVGAVNSLRRPIERAIAA